jgi:hypothetical protein
MRLHGGLRLRLRCRLGLTDQRLDDDVLRVLRRVVGRAGFQIRESGQEEQEDAQRVEDERRAEPERQIPAILSPDAFYRGETGRLRQHSVPQRLRAVRFGDTCLGPRRQVSLSIKA